MWGIDVYRMLRLRLASEVMTHVDLFSGIGGFALAAQWAGFRTVAFVEIEPYARELIKQNFGAVADAVCERRQQIAGSAHGNESENERRTTTNDHIIASCSEGRRPRIFSDIRKFDGRQFAGATLLTGGFPCQPFSQAGKRRGKEDDRYLWPEMLRVIHEARPAWVLGENVAGIVTMELDRVLSDLEGEGYAVQPIIIPACAVDARHRRDRVWIVGHAEQSRSFRRAHAGIHSEPESAGIRMPLPERRSGEDEPARWEPEPDVGRVAHGIPSRVDRLKGLGNAIIPQVAFEIVREIARLENAE